VSVLDLLAFDGKTFMSLFRTSDTFKIKFSHYLAVKATSQTFMVSNLVQEN